MSNNYLNNLYSHKGSATSNNTSNIAADRFISQKFNLNKPPKILKKYKKYRHDMKREFKWTYTPPPR